MHQRTSIYPPLHRFILIKQVSFTQSRHLSSLWSVPIRLTVKETVRLHIVKVVHTAQFDSDDFQAAVVEHGFSVHKKVSEHLQKKKKKANIKYSPFVKNDTISTTPYGPYGSTNKSRTNPFLKLFNKFKSVFMTMSAIRIKSVTLLRWIWEGRNLKENNTIKVCLKHQVPIDPFALYSNTLWT